MNLVKRDVQVLIKKCVAEPLLSLRQFFASRNSQDIFLKLIEKLKKSFVEIAQTAHFQMQLDLSKVSKKFPTQKYCVEYPYYIFYELHNNSCLIEALFLSGQDIDRILAKKRSTYVIVKFDEDIKETAKKTIRMIENTLEKSKESKEHYHLEEFLK